MKFRYVHDLNLSIPTENELRIYLAGFRLRKFGLNLSIRNIIGADLSFEIDGVKLRIEHKIYRNATCHLVINCVTNFIVICKGRKLWKFIFQK